MTSTEQMRKRGRPKSPPEYVRTQRFTVLLSPTELLALNDYSARTGLSVSEVIRTSVMATIANDRRLAS